MFYAYEVKFDVTKNLGFFIFYFWQALDSDSSGGGHPSFPLSPMSHARPPKPKPNTNFSESARLEAPHRQPHRHRHAPWALPQLASFASCPSSPCSSSPPPPPPPPPPWTPTPPWTRPRGAWPRSCPSRHACRTWRPWRRRWLAPRPHPPTPAASPSFAPYPHRRREAERRAAYATCSATRFSSASPSTPPASPRSSLPALRETPLPPPPWRPPPSSPTPAVVRESRSRPLVPFSPLAP